MAQGTRGRWIRATTAGFGMVLCTGLVGCMNWDKPKETAKAKPGLPGTPTLQQPNGVANNKMGQPPGQFTGTGSNLQQQPTFATGTQGGPFRTGPTNTNTGTAGASQNWPAQPGNPGTIGAPTVPGASASPSVLPVGGVGGPVGAAPYQNPGHSNTGVSFSSPPPPQLDIVPPAPPAGHGAFGSEVAGTGAVLPPVPTGPAGPIAPIAPPGIAPSYTGKGIN